LQTDQFQVHVAVEEHHWWFRGRRTILLDLASAILPPSKQRLVVDVGCGTGANAAAFQERYECIGIDISSEAIDAAKRRFGGVEFVCGRAPEDLGPDAGRADLFVLADVIEHIEDEFQFISELVAAAKPGAFILITVPAEPELWTDHDVSFGHYRRYLPGTLREAWQDLPVTEVVLAAFNTRLYQLIKATRAVNRRLGRTSGAAGTDFAMPLPPINALLTRVFAGESRRLVESIDSRGLSTRRHGVSLIAVLRREPGEVPVRHRVDAQQGADR